MALAPGADRRPSRVLLLLGADSARPAAIEILRGVQDGIARSGGPPTNVYVEFTRARPKREPELESKFIDWLTYKYKGDKFDVICPATLEALEIAVRLRDRVWPGTPIVYAISKTEFAQLKPEPAITGVYQELGDIDTIGAAMVMLPNSKRIALVSGSSPSDIAVHQFNASMIRKRFPSVALIEISNRSLDEVAKAVAKLPDDSFVFWQGFSYDSEGRYITNPEIATFLNKHSNRPVFSSDSRSFGLGGVGGLMNSYERAGSSMGALAAEVMKGVPPEKLQPTKVPPMAAVDWREMKKWGINPSHVPPGAEIRFRQPTLWEEHRGSILTGIGIVLLQTAMIAILLLERRKRRISEGLANETEELNRAVLASLNGQIAILDKNAKVIRLSEKWHPKERQTAALPNFEVGSDYVDSVKDLIDHGGQRQEIIRSIRAVLRGDSPMEVCEYHLNNGQSDCWYEVRVERLDSKEGGAIVTHLDITSRKRADQEHRANLDEMHRMNRISGIGQLAASLAHELAQPLTSILNNAQAAERFAGHNNPDYDEVRSALSEIVSDERRAQTIIDRMRAFMKKQNVPAQIVDLNQIAEDVHRLTHSASLTQRISLTMDLSIDPVLVLGDSVPLQQVLLNLVNNAMDAVGQVPPERRNVTIRTRALEGQAELAVEDSGPGIPSDAENKLFSSFYTTKSDGLGMGLPICQSIIETFGGKISVENRLEGGARFQVLLNQPVKAGLG